MEGGNRNRTRQTGQKTSGHADPLVALRLLFSSRRLCKCGNKEENLAKPRDLGEDCLGIAGLALARLPVLWPGVVADMPLSNGPIYVVRMFMSRRRAERTQTRTQ